jgi:hypothetical protein
MPQNLLEQLGKQPVPAAPPRLKEDVRERMNAALLALQLADLALRGLPMALFHFAHAVAGMLAYTLTGTYEPRVRDDARGDAIDR